MAGEASRARTGSAQARLVRAGVADSAAASRLLAELGPVEETVLAALTASPDPDLALRAMTDLVAAAGREPLVAMGEDARLRDRLAAVLGLLAEEPMHGYQLIREISARSGGDWRASPGSVYPTLSQLEESGLVESTEEGGRRSFSLTESGIAEAHSSADEFAALWQRSAEEPADGRGELAGLVFQVGAAAMQVGAAGSEEQRERAAELLEQTRRSLYRLLAGDEPATDDPGER